MAWKVGAAIVGAWGFPEAISQSVDINKNLDLSADGSAVLVDVVFIAAALLDAPEETFSAESPHPSLRRLKVTQDAFAYLSEAAEIHAQSMRFSI